MNLLFVYSFLGAFLLSLVLTFVGTPLYERWRLVDKPDATRKKHERVTALGGGIGIILSVLLVGAIIEWQTGHFTTGLITYTHLWGIVAGSLVILAYGLLDDWRAVRPQIAILGPIIVSGIVIAAGFEVTKVTHPFGGEIAVAPLLSALGVFAWMMVIMYSVKVADGVDGLVGSLGMTSSLMVVALALTQKYYQPDVALMALIVAGGILGFLVFNWAPASIFLGEVGSVWIGFAIAVLSIISGSKLLTALLVLAVPVCDLLFVIVRRLLAGKSIWNGDRLHLHHLLLDRGWKPAHIVLVYIAVSLSLGGISLLLVGWQKILVLALVGLLLFFRFVLGWYAKQKAH